MFALEGACADPAFLAATFSDAAAAAALAQGGNSLAARAFASLKLMHRLLVTPADVAMAMVGTHIHIHTHSHYCCNKLSISPHLFVLLCCVFCNNRRAFE